MNISGTFELFLTEGGQNDELYPFEVEVNADYTPGRAEQGPTYDCGGQPAEGPEVEITAVAVIRQINGKSVIETAPQLFKILPYELLTKWEAKLAEDYDPCEPEPPDRDDWERDQKRGQDVTKDRFNMLTGKVVAG